MWIILNIVVLRAKWQRAIHTCTNIFTNTHTHRPTLEAEVLSTVEEVMAVEASLTVVLESCSPAGLDIMRAPSGLDNNINTHTHTLYYIYIPWSVYADFPWVRNLLIWQTLFLPKGRVAGREGDSSFCLWFHCCRCYVKSGSARGCTQRKRFLQSLCQILPIYRGR